MGARRFIAEWSKIDRASADDAAGHGRKFIFAN